MGTAMMTIHKATPCEWKTVSDGLDRPLFSVSARDHGKGPHETSKDAKHNNQIPNITGSHGKIPSVNRHDCRSHDIMRVDLDQNP